MLKTSLLLFTILIYIPATYADECYPDDLPPPATGYQGCYDNNGYWQCETCECGFRAVYNIYTNLVLAALSIASCLLVIIGFIAVKDLRKAPGDIILLLSLGDLLWSYDWLVFSLRELEGDIICLDECIEYSYLYNFSRYFKTAYYLSFCLFYYITLRTSLKSSNLPQWLYHIAAIILAVVVFFYKMYNGAFGMSLNGSCGVMTS